MKKCLLIVVLVSVNTLYAQPNGASPAKLYSLAVRSIRFGEFQTALPYLLEIAKKEPTNANVNYFLGLCYFQSGDPEHAVECFEIASKRISTEFQAIYSNKKAPVETYEKLAAAYHVMYRFNDVKDVIKKYKMFLADHKIDYSTDRLEKERYNRLHRILVMCSNAQELKQQPRKVDFINLSDKLSIQGSTKLLTSYYPLSTSDQSAFFFKGEDGPRVAKANPIYYTVADGSLSNFSSPSQIVNDALLKDQVFINKFNHHIGEICFSKPGGNGKNYDLYTMKIVKSAWSEPVKLNRNINTRAEETSACLSPDGMTLFFSSNRKGGYGGMDLYGCDRMSDGSWGFAYNLGPRINTSFDEGFPYMMDDGVTLFFSSKGHNTMGGFDIFYSTLSSEGLWLETENMGFPINTTVDDIGFRLGNNERYACYSSQKDGSGSNYIIYLVTFNN